MRESYHNSCHKMIVQILFLKKVYVLISNFEEILDSPMYNVTWNNLLHQSYRCLFQDY